MVITKLMGGLGNQMFQYATGRNLSVKLQSELKIDHSFLETDTKGEYTKRHYELDAFNCIQTRASEKEIKTIYQLQKTDILSKLNNAFSNKTINIFNEKGVRYTAEVEKLSGDIYLNGYWQSEKYFTSIRKFLLKEFSLKHNLNVQAAVLKNRILHDHQSVSIHFRRGDYVNSAAANSYHGTADLAYYHTAISIVKSKINNPSFYIFSDDINWVKENFKIDNAIYVEGLESQEDLELIKNCSHNITANSSFSWWGAWLNTNPAKIVIAPKQWFKDSTIDTSDLIPAAWLKI